MLGPIGTQEILIIAFVILLLFGAKKIPDFARSLGQGLNEFKKGKSELEPAVEEARN